MDVVELYRSLADDYRELVANFISNAGSGDAAAKIKLAELELLTAQEKNRKQREDEERIKLEMEKQNAEKLQIEFNSLSKSEKDRFNYINKYFSPTNGYKYKNKQSLNATYERVFEVRRKFKCLGLADAGDETAMKNESEVNKEYAEKYIAVDHVFLIMKNMVSPQASTDDLAIYLSEIKEFQTYCVQNKVNVTDTTAFIKASKQIPNLEPSFKKISQTQTNRKREIVSGNNIIRFYDRENDKFITDPLITKQNDITNIQLLTTSSTLPVYEKVPPKDWLSGYNFTFSKVFNGLLDENNVNLYQAVQGVTENADLPITFITYGQSGSGKSTTALYLLQQLVGSNENYTFSAIQWLLTVDGDEKLRKTKVLHDIGKLMVFDDKPIVNSTFVYTNEEASLVANKEFEFEEFDGTAAKKSVRFMEDIKKFQKELEKFKFTRSTVMNKDSSRSILFFTIYDEHENPKFSMVDLPGNEELEVVDPNGINAQQKETKAIKPALSMFKALFLNKQKNRRIDELGTVSKNSIFDDYDIGKPGETVREILQDETFGELCLQLQLLEPYTMQVLNTDKTKLVLLLTSYGVNKVDDANSAEKLSRIIRTSKDTFEFAKTLSTTQAVVPCTAELDRKIELVVGGKRTRRIQTKHSHSRKRYKNVHSIYK
jgi:DNA polymerase III delta prime subunit